MEKAKSIAEEYPLPVPKMRWLGIIFFALIHLIGIIGTPLYIIYRGITLSEIVLFTFFFIMTSMAITVGYHRLFAHVTFKTRSIVRFFLLLFGAATFEESALKWASQHRQHHLFTDTEHDPYGINKGFWHAHAGWILFWRHRTNYNNVNDLKRSKLVLHQHKWHPWWSVGGGIALPMLIGTWMGHPLGTFTMTVCLRLVFVMHSAFFINSFAHTFGEKTFDGAQSASDHWLGALLTNGEGYHNFHHCFPNDYRNGIKWYHWDPTKWFIYGLSKLNLTWDLKKTSEQRMSKASSKFSPNVTIPS